MTGFTPILRYFTICDPKIKKNLKRILFDENNVPTKIRSSEKIKIFSNIKPDFQIIWAKLSRPSQFFFFNCKFWRKLIMFEKIQTFCGTIHRNSKIFFFIFSNYLRHAKYDYQRKSIFKNIFKNFVKTKFCPLIFRVDIEGDINIE